MTFFKKSNVRSLGLLTRRPMLLPPRITTNLACVVLLGSCVRLLPTASAQDFTTQVGNPDPMGLGNLVPIGDALVFGSGPGLKGGYAYGFGIETVYDSNLFLQENNPEDEISTNLSPWFSYTTDPEGGANFSVSANYHPVIRAYLNNSDLGGMDQSGDISMKIIGAKTAIDGYTRFSELSGTDRLTGKFVTGSLLNTGMQGTYQIAPRTLLSANWSAAMSDYGSSSLVGADIYTLEVGGYWAATERFSYGPAVRYAIAKSDNTGTRDAWALYMQARYLAGEKIQISGSLGIDYAKSSRDGDNGTIGVTGDLVANYAINQLWTLSNGIHYVTVPSPTDTNYVVNNLLISSGISRALLRATVGMGLDLNFSYYEGVGAVTTQLGNESNLATYLTYRRKLFSERLDFESKVRYSVNSGQVDWDQVQVSAGLEVQF